MPVLVVLLMVLLVLLLRLHTNTNVRTKHRAFSSSLNVPVTTTIHNATLRFSKDYHPYGDVKYVYIFYYTYTYVRCYVHWYLGYVQTVMYVGIRALLLKRHLIEWPYCGRILSMTSSIAKSCN
jgi:hypothetical protein